MTTFLLVVVLLGLAIGGMAIGVLCGRAPIAGSCGGLNRRDGGACASCSRPCSRRRAAASNATTGERSQAAESAIQRHSRSRA